MPTIDTGGLSTRYQPGDYIEGRFRVVRGPFSGGMSVVYAAEDLEAGGGLVALKALPLFLLRPAAQRRFLDEIATWINLERHANVIPAEEVIRTPRSLLLRLEYAPGGDLGARIAAGGYDDAQVARWALDICRGMEWAHGKVRLVHRDLKPANVLLDAGGTARVTDFGLSYSLHVEAEEEGSDAASRPLTPDSTAATAAFAGTLPYASPEHFRRLSACDTRSDVYSFGALPYELLTGRPDAFHAEEASRCWPVACGFSAPCFPAQEEER